MLRSVEKDGRAVVEAAEAFGLSRPVYYVTRELFSREGLPARLSEDTPTQADSAIHARTIVRVATRLIVNDISSRARVNEAINSPYGRATKPPLEAPV
jgi:transposase-like protein